MTLLLAIIVLSLLIFVHEAGHFFVARRLGIKVEEFGFGFPPRAWGKRVGETIYSINWLPVGGFVRLYGEDSSVSREQEKAFYHKGKLARSTVIVAGVVMNFLLGVLAFAIVAWVVGVPREAGKIEILGVSPGSPAEEAKLQQGDVIVEVEGQKISETKEFISIVGQHEEEQLNLAVDRGGEEITFSVAPRDIHPEDEGPLGVIISDMELYHPPILIRPFWVLWEGVREAVFWVTAVVVAIGGAIAQAVKGVPPEGIAGPVGIFQITGAAARQGILPLISFIGIFSVNLAVLNIVPFPALDGGRLLFILVEAIFGRKVRPKFEQVAHMVGMAILLLLLLLITFQDIQRLLTGGFEFLRQP